MECCPSLCVLLPTLPQRGGYMSQDQQQAERSQGVQRGSPQDIALEAKSLHSYDRLDNQATWKLSYYHLNMINMLTKEKDL